jgi:hypothetical protein
LFKKIGILIFHSFSIGSNIRGNEKSVDLNALFGNEDLPDRELRSEEQAFPFGVEIISLKPEFWFSIRQLALNFSCFGPFFWLFL